MQRTLVLSLSFAAVCMLFLTGCGGGEDIPANYKTVVEVTYKGAPVDSAMVTLRPDGHQAPSATGVTGADGKVELFSYKGKGDGVIPGNYLIGIFKETPLLSVITIAEMLTRAKDYASENFRYTEAYIMVGVVFLVLSIPASYFVNWSERRFKRGYGRK